MSVLLTQIQCIFFFWPSCVLLKGLWEVLKIIQTLGEPVTAHCISWSHRVVRCGLAHQAAAAAALASVCMIHPMILSIFVILPCLCDPTQLYKPRAVYHLDWGKWLNTGSRMHAQISGWAPTCWLLHNAVRHGSFPASSIFHFGRQRLWGLTGFT